jgi:hypothetical protein
VLHIGGTTRFAKMNNKVVENTTFSDFCKENNMLLPTGYRRAIKNLPAGFASCAKYDKPQPTYDKYAWAMACDWTRNHFGAFVRGGPVLSKEEAVLELDKTTSCGFPWSLSYHSKAEFLASPATGILDWYWDYVANSTQTSARQRFELFESSDVSDSTQYHPIWTCTQKVEMRSVDKLIDNRLRTFTAAPVEHTLALTRMCLAFNNAFYAADKTWSFVGRSKYASGWHRLITRLSRHSKGIEMDAKDWDSSCHQDALMDQCFFRWECLPLKEHTQANLIRLVNLYKEIIASVIVMENGELIWKNTGNPSGSANTIVDNTMILFRVIAYAWIRCCPPEYLKYTEFMRCVEGALNGDDNDLSIADEAIGFFNIASIQQSCAELGYVMKTAHDNFVPIKDLTFLSQSSVWMFNQWLPCPDKDKYLCSLWWGSETDDVRWHLLRAAALYVDGWPNLELRAVLKQYIDYLCVRYRDDFVGVINGIPMVDILNNIKNDAWCQKLYTGQECSLEIPKWLNWSAVKYVIASLKF